MRGKRQPPDRSPLPVGDSKDQYVMRVPTLITVDSSNPCWHLCWHGSVVQAEGIKVLASGLL